MVLQHRPPVCFVRTVRLQRRHQINQLVKAGKLMCVCVCVCERHVLASKTTCICVSLEKSQRETLLFFPLLSLLLSFLSAAPAVSTNLRCDRIQRMCTWQTKLLYCTHSPAKSIRVVIISLLTVFIVTVTYTHSFHLIKCKSVFEFLLLKRQDSTLLLCVTKLCFKELFEW